MPDIISVVDVFEASQDNIQCHDKLIRSLTAVFSKIDSKEGVEKFADTFHYCLKHCLIVGEQQAVVDNCLQFCAKFVVGISSSKTSSEENPDEEDEDDESLNVYFTTMFWEFILTSHGAVSQAVRWRICQLVSKIFNLMDDEAQVIEALFVKIQRAMIERLCDRAPAVRVQAASALSRLQDSDDENCPATKALVRHIGRDPNHEVRCAIVCSLLPSKKVILPLLERTMDVKDTVRKAAYNMLASRVHIRALTIAHRISILKRGLHDRSDVVQKVVRQSLVPNWIKMLNGDPLQFLRCLDVQGASEISEEVLILVLTKKESQDIVEGFDILGEDHIIRDDALSVESAFYWRVVCELLKKRSGDSEEFLEKLLPDVPPFCSYIKSFASDIDDVEDVGERLDKEFIYGQLIGVVNVYDLADEEQRRCLHGLVKDVLQSPKLGVSLMESMLKILRMVLPESVDRADFFMETVSAIRQQINVIEVGLTPDELRNNKLSLAKAKVEMNIVRDEIEACVAVQDFEKAKEAKDRLTVLEERLAALIQQGECRTQEEVREEKNDDFTLTKCLLIACELLKDTPFQLEMCHVQSLVENLFSPSIQSENEVVRCAAVRFLGLCSLLNADLAKKHLVLLLQIVQLDTLEMRVNALKAIFDCLLLFGFEVFTSEDSGTEAQNATSDRTGVLASSTQLDKQFDPTGNVLSILLTYLDSEVSSEHTLAAEGLAKLLLARRIVSPKIVSRLIIMWYSPVFQDDDYLLNCLGVFFPAFAAASSSNQATIAEAFIPTIRDLFSAPTSSPLHVIDAGGVGCFMVRLTKLSSEGVSVSGGETAASNPHDYLAIAICKEILNSPQHFGVPTLIDILRQLQVTPTRRRLLMDLTLFLKSILKKLKDRRCVQRLNGFLKEVDAKLSKLPAESWSDEECPAIVPALSGPVT